MISDINPSIAAAYVSFFLISTALTLIMTRIRRKCHMKMTAANGRGKDSERILILASESEISRTKRQLIDVLREGGGRMQVADPAVAEPLLKLREAFQSSGVDCRHVEPGFVAQMYDGDFVMAHNPSFLAQLGNNRNGDPLFTMGRMSFGMIRPTDVVCSIQRVTQHVHKLSKLNPDGRWEIPANVPPKLRDAVELKAGELRSFVTYMDFTVEDADPRRKMGKNTAKQGWINPRGVMRCDGYAFPHPMEPNRYAVWFTGGICHAKSAGENVAWRDIFGGDLPSYTIGEKFSLLVARVLMGAEPSMGAAKDGALSFSLKTPIPGYQDVVYVDADLRITVGNAGTVVVVSRLPGLVL